MTKTCKRSAFFALLTLCVAALLGLAVACDNYEEPSGETKTYSVTVKLDADTPAPNVKVRVGTGSSFYEPKKTGSDGKAVFSLAEGSYSVVLSDLPNGYSLPQAPMTLTATAPDLVVTLVKNFAYTVNLVDENDAPFTEQGVSVILCTLGGTNCLQGVPAVNGVASIEADKGDYHAKLDGLPAGFAYDSDGDGYYAGENLSATDTEITIKIYAVEAIDLSAEAMTEEQKTAFAVDHPMAGYAESARQFPARIHNVEIAANGVTYFSLTPSMSGMYRFFNYAANENVTFLRMGETFTVNAGYSMAAVALEKGVTYYYRAINDSDAAASVPLLVASPLSSYIEHAGKAGTVDVIVGSADTNAIIAFAATEAGEYKATVQGEALAYIVNSESAPYEQMISAPSDGDYAQNANASASVAPKAASQGYPTYFAVAIKASAYPVTVQVKLEQTAKSNYTYTVVQVTETLSKYADAPENKELAYVPMDATADLVYNSTDKYYHLGTIDGPVVVISLTRELNVTRFSEGGMFAYLDLIDSRLASYAFTDPDNDKNTLDYTIFLRGFSEYDMEGRRPVIPSQITTETYYAKYVNADGVYPLTQELKSFIERFFTANYDSLSWQLPMEMEMEDVQAYGWMFPLCYYVDAAPADPIVGAYKLSSYNEEGTSYNVGDSYESYGPIQGGVEDGVITADSAVLTLKKDGTFALMIGADSYDHGTWTKEEDYAFTCNFGTLTYNSETKTFTYVEGDYTFVFVAEQA